MSFLAKLSRKRIFAARLPQRTTRGAAGQDIRRKFFWCLFFKDKFVWNEFEQPKAGPKGKLQGCSL
ncbi:MAG: hypothetical protein A3I13_04615 [Gammaproteobacteria bacterium RIFCSPLOWO2_02_FULL_47_50]|nr:MAG: hypothetical protein A2993_03735 [Gammaproteobacteria bacterium RIFCSPLOWO2_01_FULL_47_190]OGT78187.1 MAG: hypothetical protein A3I13_04615 [Gammaproteobacteria bacterium RIFCSPLOWO2_02_FULL_47_50]